MLSATTTVSAGKSPEAMSPAMCVTALVSVSKLVERMPRRTPAPVIVGCAVCSRSARSALTPWLSTDPASSIIIEACAWPRSDRLESWPSAETGSSPEATPA